MLFAIGGTGVRALGNVRDCKNSAKFYNGEILGGYFFAFRLLIINFAY